MPSNGAPTDDDVDRAIALVRGKSTRYRLKNVWVSRRLVLRYTNEQLERLERTLAEDGVTISWKGTSPPSVTGRPTT